MRIAVCLYGMLGYTKSKYDDTLGSKCDPKIGFNQYKHHLFDKNENVDTFLHTRDLDYEQQLLDLYKPKKYIAEPFTDFNTEHLIKGTQPIEHQRKCSKTMWSRFYSLDQVVKQKTAYEEEQGFKYDFVFVSRYDLVLFEDVIFSDYDPEYFHAPFAGWMFNNRPAFISQSIPDLWFFSSSEQINEFAKIYNDLERYSKDTQNNHVSQHFAVANKLKESNSKLRFVLNMDIDYDDHDATRCPLVRNLGREYWGYDKENELYFVKPYWLEKVNKSQYDMDWTLHKHAKQNWDIYD